PCVSVPAADLPGSRCLRQRLRRSALAPGVSCIRPAAAWVQPLSLHAALPISILGVLPRLWRRSGARRAFGPGHFAVMGATAAAADRKSTRLHSSHVEIPYAGFGLKQKTKTVVSGTTASEPYPSRR